MKIVFSVPVKVLPETMERVMFCCDPCNKSSHFVLHDDEILRGWWFRRFLSSMRLFGGATRFRLVVRSVEYLNGFKLSVCTSVDALVCPCSDGSCVVTVCRLFCCQSTTRACNIILRSLL